MPLLVDEGRTIPETSIIIIERLQRHHASPGRALIPYDADAALQVRLWDRIFDQYVMTPMQAFTTELLRSEADRDALNVSQTRELLLRAYELIDQHLEVPAPESARVRIRPPGFDASTALVYCFDYSRIVGMRMNARKAVSALAALAHESRLSVYRLLVEAGPGGMPAGVIAEKLKLPPSSLTFHLQNLQRAGLITQERVSRQLIYAADFRTMNALVDFLTENCCRGSQACSASCEPASQPRYAARKRSKASG